jgi:3D (Asp-Asp-Asp) domain-containing protein
VIRRVYRVTAYSDRGLTASGVWSGVGQCAAPADIPFGSRVHIPALGRTLVVTDRTHRRFRHNTVDIYMPSYSECRQFGRRYLECIVELPLQPYEYGSPDLEQLVRSGPADRSG